MMPSKVTLVPSVTCMLLKGWTKFGGTGTMMVRSTGWNFGGISVVMVVAYLSSAVIRFFGLTSVIIVVEWWLSPPEDMYLSSDM